MYFISCSVMSGFFCRCLHSQPFVHFLSRMCLPPECLPASASRWVNQAHAAPHSFHGCQSSAAAAASGRTPSPPPRRREEWETAFTPPRPPAPTPARAALANAGACFARRLSVSQPRGTVIRAFSPST